VGERRGRSPRSLIALFAQIRWLAVAARWCGRLIGRRLGRQALVCAV
jgi:hypothetical protein